MTEAKATLVLDLGNSDTKCRVYYGTNPQTGKKRFMRFDLPNSFALVEDDYQVDETYYDPYTSCMFRVNQCEGDENTLITGTFLHGKIQKAEKANSAIRPTAKIKKYLNKTTTLSYIRAVFEAQRCIARMAGTTVDQVDVEWNIVALLPPRDIKVGASMLANMIKSIKSVEYLYPSITVPFKVDKVAVYPEGYAAFVALAFEEGANATTLKRAGYENLTNEITMIVDIGGGTTDILFIRGDNGKLSVVSGAMATIPKGGNDVRESVKRQVEEDNNGLVLSDEAIMNGCITGFVKDGKRQVDVSQAVITAKNIVSSTIANEIQGLMDVVDFSIREVENLLVCGGGSIGSGHDSIKSLADYIEDSLHDYIPYIELLKLPKEIVVTVDDTTGAKVQKEVEFNPRDLNLIGAGILGESL